MHFYDFAANSLFLITTMIDLEEAPKVMECRKCKTGFTLRTKIIPFDIVLSHEECWMCPDPKDLVHGYKIRWNDILYN